MSKAPDTIGRYKILGRIGQGGMGVLFLALDPMLERQLAIKLLRDDNEELRERFAREARSVARLRHPNIVTVFDVGEQDGQPFIAMEYIQGQTLADIIRAAAPIDITRKLQIVDELCDGLGFAHKLGIVHRDVKPANVMVEPDGVVKILDFGIARIAESGMTQAGMLIGTLNYMSPEQVAGQVVDGRSDIFAVGNVLYELIAYRQAFPGGLQNGILNKILHEQPPPLATLCPGLDPEVIRIVDRALQKDPETRYQDLAAMRKDLQRVLQRLEVETPETVAIRPDDNSETVAIEAPTEPVQRAQTPTPRWGTDRDGLARRRATQIAAHLGDAHRAMEAHDYEGAVAAAEQALLLHAEEPEAIQILERARLALDERQLKDWLDKGAALLQEGAHTEALDMVDQAAALAPGSSAVRDLRRAIDQARAERARQREREAAIRAAVERAQSLFDREAYDEADKAAAEALALSPDLPLARTLQARAREAVELQRVAALERRVSAALADAQQIFAEGRHDDAIGALDAFEPSHPRVSAAIDELRLAAARIKRERDETRQREEQIAAAIAQAAKTPSHDAAIAALQGALTLDAGRADIRSLIVERQKALDAEHEAARRIHERDQAITAALAKAKSTAAHEAAIATLKEARSLDPSRTDIGALIDARQAALDAEREDARRLRELQQATAAALAKAKATAPHEAAIAMLEAAAALDPGNADVRRQIADRRAALDRERDDARRVRERQEAIAAALAKAAKTPAHAAAVAIIEEALALDPAHADARARLAERQAALQREQEEARKARERQERIDRAIADAKGTASHEAAIAILTSALERDPHHKEITSLLETRRTALEDDARRVRERHEKSAAAIAKAKAATAHETAITLLKDALALDPQHAEIRQLLKARETALERERDEARRARERQDAIGAAIARAKGTAGHEAALAILKEALALDPRHAETQSLIAARQAALDKEREAARLERERQAKVADIVGRAKAAKAHDAAIALLEQALALDGSHREARSLLEARETALKAERAETARIQAIETARQSIGGLIAKSEFDAAESALQKAEDGLQAKKPLKDLHRAIKDARKLKSATAASETGSGAPHRPAVMVLQRGRLRELIGAAAVVVLGVGGYVVYRQTTTPPSTPPSATTAIAQPPDAGSAPSTAPGVARSNDPAPVTTAPPLVTQPAEPPPAEPPAAAPPSTASNDAATLAGRTAAAVQLGRQQLGRGDVLLAATTTAAGLKLDPANRDLRQLASDIFNRARDQAVAAKRSATGRGELATASKGFRDAQQRETEAARHQRLGRNEQAVRVLTEASALYAQADKDAQTRMAAAAAASASKPVPAPPGPGRSSVPANPAPAPDVPAGPPAGNPTSTPGSTTAAPTPPPVAPPPAPKPQAAAPVVNEEEAIKATLRAYAVAMQALDVPAVSRVYPGVDAAALKRNFDNTRTLQMEIQNEQIGVAGTEATVTCRIAQTFTFRVGAAARNVIPATFKLRKTGTTWIIVSRN